MKAHTVRLNSGHDLPLLGLGTWQSNSDETILAVKTALELGYRHIDTALNYKNEKDIGLAIKEWIKNGGKREELFITTKLPTFGNRPGDVCKYLERSLTNLQLDYVDLYLMHMPFTLSPNPAEEGPEMKSDGSVATESTDHLLIWKEMEAQVRRGAVKSIGVSNFNTTQLERLCGGTTILPAVLQVEMHLYLQQPDVQLLANNLKVQIVAYSPLGSPGIKKHLAEKYGILTEVPDILHDPELLEIAKCTSKTPAQVLLTFLIQQGIAVIPKSIKPERIKENANIFDYCLNKEDMEKLKSLDRGAEGRIINFLFWKGVENHPEYPFHKELPVIMGKSHQGEQK